MNGKDIVNLPNSRAELAFDRDGDGNLRLTIIDLLGKAEAEASTPEQTKKIANAKKAVETAEADPTNSDAKDKAVKAAKDMADSGYISREEFEEFKKNVEGRLSSLESFEKSVREVLPKNEKGDLLVIDMHIRDLVAGVRGVNPTNLTFSFTRFLMGLGGGWLVFGLLIALIFGWGTFNAVVLGLLAGGIIGFAFGFKNEHADN